MVTSSTSQSIYHAGLTATPFRRHFYRVCISRTIGCRALYWPVGPSVTKLDIGLHCLPLYTSAPWMYAYKSAFE